MHFLLELVPERLPHERPEAIMSAIMTIQRIASVHICHRTVRKKRKDEKKE